MARWLFAMAAWLLLLAPRNAAAQNEVPPELPRGFARASLGVGELWIHDASYGQWGRIIPLELAGGVAIAPRVALFGALYGTRIVAPVSDEYRLSSVTLYGAGPGVQWQLEHPNIFIAGSVSVSRLHIDRADTQPDDTSHWGILGRLSLGTQWRAAPHWWLGLAGELTLGRMATTDTQANFGRGNYIAKGFALLFSGTVGSPSRPDSGETTSPGRVHDGFFVNAAAGVGGIWVTGGLSTRNGISGWATPLALEVGYALRPELLAYGEFYESYVPVPSEFPLVDLEVTGLGPGLRYELLPAGVSFSLTVLVAQLRFHDSDPADTFYGINASSKWRFLGRASVAKHWWISSRWQLGVAGEATLGRLPPELRPGFGSYPSYTVKGVAALISASFD